MLRMKGAFALFLLAMLTVPPAAAEPSAVDIPSARWSALGGRHVAVADDFQSIFTNPAGFATDTPVLSATRMSLDVAGPMFDFAALVTNGGDPASDITGLLDDEGRLYARFDLAGPISLGYVGGGLGLGVFVRETAEMNVTSIAAASFAIDFDILVVGGYAHRFDFDNGHVLDAGFMPKGFIKNEFRTAGTLTEVMAKVGDVMADGTYTVATGVGLDAGVRWNWTTYGLGAGFVARDLLTVVMESAYTSFSDFGSNPSASRVGDMKTALALPNLCVGVQYRPTWGFLALVDTDLRLMLDYEDALSFVRPAGRNALLNLGLGAEFTLLEILSFRAGIKDALPSAGFGADLTLFTVGLSMYGEELGLEPGDRPVFNMILAFEFEY